MSSFGISGTNAHVIVEAAPVEPVREAGPARSVVPWVLSAKSAAALAAQAARLAEHLRAHDELDVADVAWSLAGRATFEHRAVVVGGDRDRLLAGLAELASDDPAGSVIRGTATPAGKTVFVFPGQGTQWLGMGIELLDAAPVFAEQLAGVRRSARGVRRLVADRRAARRTRCAGLDRVDVVQPVLFAVMVSLAELWRSVGVQPGRGDRPLAGRDRRGLRRRCAVAARRRPGGRAAQQAAASLSGPGGHGVHGLRHRAGPGVVGALR